MMQIRKAEQARIHPPIERVWPFRSVSGDAPNVRGKIRDRQIPSRILAAGESPLRIRLAGLPGCHRIESSQNGTVDQMREQHGDWRLVSIVERQEAGWLELAGNGGP